MLFVALIFFGSCSPKISTNIRNYYQPIDYRQDIVVFGLNDEEPFDAEVLGQVKIGDTGFTTKCSYEIVIEKAKMEARKAGGNAIKIVEHKPPSIMGSSCHRITAWILQVNDFEYYLTEEEDPILDVDYAIINVYRYGGSGTLVSYDLYLGNSVICRVRNNFKTTLYIEKEGLNTLWAKTEAKSEVPINIKMGKTYYLRCGISMGAFVGRPVLELIDSKTGKDEFEFFKAKNQ